MRQGKGAQAQYGRYAWGAGDNILERERWVTCTLILVCCFGTVCVHGMYDLCARVGRYECTCMAYERASGELRGRGGWCKCARGWCARENMARCTCAQGVV